MCDGVSEPEPGLRGRGRTGAKKWGQHVSYQWGLYTSRHFLWAFFLHFLPGQRSGVLLPQHWQYEHYKKYLRKTKKWRHISIIDIERKHSAFFFVTQFSEPKINFTCLLVTKTNSAMSLNLCISRMREWEWNQVWCWRELLDRILWSMHVFNIILRLFWIVVRSLNWYFDTMSWNWYVHGDYQVQPDKYTYYNLLLTNDIVIPCYIVTIFFRILNFLIA